MDLQNSIRRHFDNVAPKFITWEFYEPYTKLEPPFGQLGLPVYLRTYSRHIATEKRREKWCETVMRNVEFSIGLDNKTPFAQLQQEAQELFDYMFNLRTFPSGRSLWTAGSLQTKTDPSSTWNCTFRVIDSISAYGEIFYWLLIGSGCGFSVEKEYTGQLPSFFNHNKTVKHINQERWTEGYDDTELSVYVSPGISSINRLTKNDLLVDDCEYLKRLDLPYLKTEFTIIVGDSKEGWVNALKTYLTLLTQPECFDITFDYKYVRPPGVPLKTFGGVATGCKNFVRMIDQINFILQGVKGKLNTNQAMDLVGIVALCVVSGNIRRSALIALGEPTDDLFKNAKYDLWVDEEKEPYRPFRVMSNNSIVVDEKPTKEELYDVFEKIKSNGEPGLWIRGNARKYDPDIVGTNPCVETGLLNQQSCNLTTNNVVAFVKYNENNEPYLDEYEWRKSVYLSTRIGSRVTTLPQWHPEWDKVQKSQRLLGVSMTGERDAVDLLNWSEEELEDFWTRTKLYVREVADQYHEQLGIERAARVSCVKPEGCRPASSMTTTEQGVLTLYELFDKHKDNTVWSDSFGYTVLDENGKNKITKTYDNGVKSVYRITLSYGFQLECTENHKWYVKERAIRDGKNVIRGYESIEDWVETQHLTSDDIIETNINLYNKQSNAKLHTIDRFALSMRRDATLIKQPNEMSPDICWLLGYLWGDGSLSQSNYRIRFIDQKTTNLEKVQRILIDNFGIGDNAQIIKCKNKDAYTYDVGSIMFWNWLIKNEIWKYYNNDVNILPKAVRTSSKECVISFIAGLIDSDGCVHKSNNTYKLSISTASDSFAKHLQEVAAVVGLILGRSLNTKGENLQNRKNIWNLSMCSHTTVETFNILRKHSTKIQLADENDVVWSVLNSPKCMKKLGMVSSVEYLEDLPTYDIEVENTHFYYDGVYKSHNTISQLPTVSSGVHRSYAPHYIRRVRFSSVDPLAKALLDVFGEENVHPENGQGDNLYADGVDTWVFSFPIETAAHIRAIDESAISQLEHYRLAQTSYTADGHNTSITVTVAPDEWDDVVEWVYENWDCVIGVSFLPKYDPEVETYPQMPYEPCSEEVCNELKEITPTFTENELISLIAKHEDQYDEYEILDEACSSGVCPIR